MTSDIVHLLQAAAHGLWTFGAVAGGSSILGLAAINTGPLTVRVRRRPRSTDRWRATPAVAAAAAAAPASAPAAPAAATAPDAMRSAASTGTAAGLSTAEKVDTSPADLASELGLGGLADRAGLSHARSKARDRTGEQLRALAGPRCLVEPEFELAGEHLPTLLSTSGVFVVLLTQGSPNSLATIASLEENVAKREPALVELEQLIEGVRPTPVFYSPNVAAAARCWFVGEHGEHRVFTAGGLDALRELLATERGPGLSETALEVFAHAIRSPSLNPDRTIPDPSTGHG